MARRGYQVHFEHTEKTVRLYDDSERVAGAKAAGGTHTLQGFGGREVIVDMDKVTHIETERSDR